MCAIWLAAVDGSSPPAKLTAITLTASLIDQAERFLPELATSSRINGHTWHDIAQALATSPDEAPPAIRPRLPGRRRPLALRHLKPQRRGHFKPSQQRRTRTRWGQIKPSWRGQIRPS
jgi:hypothetical protein